MNGLNCRGNQPDRGRGGAWALLSFAARFFSGTGALRQRSGMVHKYTSHNLPITRLIIVVCGVVLFGIGRALAQPEPSPPQWQNDAELTSVAFIDADRGWAVGDRGVIWHTADGGNTWKLQNSGVTCRLEAVQFLDGENGYAVGGWTQPYTHETHGVALRTRDGGKT